MHEVENLTAAKEPPPEPPGVLLIEQESPPLHEILQVVNKVSQNLHAELTLREVGRVTRNVGSRAAGLAELSKFLAEIGVGKASYNFEDASGLSTMNLVSPAALVRLLHHMYLSEDRDGWLELMPIGGEDGTLDYRFRSPATHGRVRAKTGTLTGVSALSGYLDTASGRKLAFSIMLNNYNTKSRPAREFIDAVVRELLKE
jgi:D-alanyl-D-alanine carboxypeptidase/D-alanyl-D-alanine-endopeptidase (penicillin-binding protein 4)